MNIFRSLALMRVTRIHSLCLHVLKRYLGLNMQHIEKLRKLKGSFDILL